MSKLTLKFTCPDCGKVEVNVTPILDGRQDDTVKEYTDARCPLCEDKLIYVSANDDPAYRADFGHGE